MDLVMLNETHFVTLYQDLTGMPYIRMGTRDRMWEPLSVVFSVADNLRMARVDCNHIVVACTHDWQGKGHGVMAIFAVAPEEPSGWSRKFSDIFNGDRTDSFDLQVVEPHGIVLAYLSIRECSGEDFDCDTHRAHIRNCKIFTGYLNETIRYSPDQYFSSDHSVHFLHFVK